jgi:hypothetical protein
MYSQIKNTGIFRHRVLVGVPTLGTVRIEWHNAMNALVIPVNWSNSYQTPIGFMVDDAQNIIVKEALEKGFEWVLFIEDDVLPPPDLLLRLNQYINKKEIPIISGWYNLKSTVFTPLVFRGRGNGAFTDWKPGDKVWVDGVPTGCLLVHCSIFIELAKISENYELRANNQKIILKRVFQTPRMVFTDPSLPTYQKLVGTSDLYFCDKVMNERILEKAGWKKIAKKKYPFLFDSGIRCGHIDRETGQIY